MGLVLAIDVGKGTEDVLIWDQEQQLENAIQLILPSNTQLINQQIEKLIDNQEKIVITGEIMAGEPWNRLLYSYASNFPGYIIMTPVSAKSLRYHLPHVESRGIAICEDSVIEQLGLKPNIYTTDILWNRIISTISTSGYNIDEIGTILICAQDHGQPPNPTQSTRDYRMRTIYDKLKTSGRLEDLLLTSDEISITMPRHKALAESALKRFPHLSRRQIFVMDSSPAVVLGALQHRQYELVVNVGNGHCIVIGLHNDLVQFVYELHTGGVSPERITRDIEMIFEGTLTHEHSLEIGGHGLYVAKYPDKSNYEKYFPITLIGPNRDKLLNLDVFSAHPAGNMMMAGPIGLIKAHEYQKKKNQSK